MNPTCIVLILAEIENMARECREIADQVPDEELELKFLEEAYKAEKLVRVWRQKLAAAQGENQ